jgi:hypothetical protein
VSVTSVQLLTNLDVSRKQCVLFKSRGSWPGRSRERRQLIWLNTRDSDRKIPKLNAHTLEIHPQFIYIEILTAEKEKFKVSMVRDF